MDFSFTEDQQMLRDSVARMLGDLFPAGSTPVGGQDNWAAFAEMGLTALPFAEDDGGLGGGPVDTMVVMEEIGRSGATDPYLACTVLAGALVRLAGSADQRAALVPGLAEGSLRMAAALYEPGGRYDLHHVATTAVADGGGHVLNGHKAVVLGADVADRLIVSARTSGDTCDRDGISLFLIDASAPGVSRRNYRTHDGLGAAEVALDGVRVGAGAMMGSAGNALGPIEGAVDHAIAARLAEAVGAMEAALELTRDYIATRRQFGRPLADFQVMQHKFADMVCAHEQALSMSYLAASAVSLADPLARAKEISGVAWLVGRSARQIAHDAVQMHGGIGMTREYRLGGHLKRLIAATTTFGDTDHFIARHGAADNAAA